MEQFDLTRFVTAQNDGDTYTKALAELRRGRKTSHWMWFVFPQIAGLGQSATSRHFAIVSLAEARAYLAHPLLGPRLIEVTNVVLGLETRSAEAVFGSIDAQKLQSSATLFERAEQRTVDGHADPEEPSIFGEVITKFFDTLPDAATLERL